MKATKQLAKCSLKITIAISAFAAVGCATEQTKNWDLSAVHQKLEHPQRCLALSGGGLRSAAFSLGVIRGLYLQGAYENLDIVSAASGGSWALLWLHRQLSESTAASLQSVLGTDQQESDALKALDNAAFIGNVWKGWTAFWGFLRMAQPAYYGALYGKFGFPVSFPTSSLISNVVDKGQPVPIVVISTFPQCFKGKTASLYDISGPSVHQLLNDLMPIDDHLIELTPLSWGSDKYGYTEEFPYVLDSVSEWARISGAFIDGPGYNHCSLMGILGEKFGSTVSAPNSGESIYVADGGFADNLALKNVIDRKCKTTIVVDAEHDPALDFGSYRRLRCDLWKSTGRRLVVPEIDSWLNDPGPCEVSAEHSGMVADDGLNPVVRQPLSDGCVTNGENCDIASPLTQRIRYLKLTFDSEPSAGNTVWREQVLFDEIQKIYDIEAHSKECANRHSSGNDDDCSFPQTPTTKGNYSAEEFEGYRALGEYLVRKYLTVQDYPTVDGMTDP